MIRFWFKMCLSIQVFNILGWIGMRFFLKLMTWDIWLTFTSTNSSIWWKTHLSKLLSHSRGYQRTSIVTLRLWGKSRFYYLEYHFFINRNVKLHTNNHSKNVLYYRLGRLKVRVLKEQEALQRRVALAAKTGHDRNCKLGLISNIWRRILEIFP